ncbi:MAG: transcriptional regulatory protein [Chloroflexi bacterium]|jgi:XRE family transcriptional regulator of biofilm formation|nr:transcriptional regulatory protein [Chloroflexota bacterium]
MNKGNDFATEIDPITSVNGYIRMTSLENGKTNGSTKNLLTSHPHGESSDVEPREIRRRGRKRGSTNPNATLALEPRRRKRDSEVIVGERIRRLRLEAGLSQEELGRSSKMSTSYISRLETGEVNPTVDALTRIVRVFGLSIDGLLELDTEAPQILSSEELDPEIRVWLFKLKGKPVSARTKRIIQTVIEEELKDLDLQEAAS